MVNVVNAAGVDINKAVNNPYYQHLLPYVSGLGPRKAQVLIKKIIKLVCSFFIKLSVLGVELRSGRNTC